MQRIPKVVADGGKIVREPPGPPYSTDVHVPLDGLRIQVTGDKIYISVADKEGPRAFQGLNAIALLHERMTQHKLDHATFERDDPRPEAGPDRCKVPDTIIIG